MDLISRLHHSRRFQFPMVTRLALSQIGGDQPAPRCQRQGSRFDLSQNLLRGRQGQARDRSNISDLPDDLLAVIKNRLASGQPLVGNGGTMTIERSLPLDMWPLCAERAGISDSIISLLRDRIGSNALDVHT